MILNSIIKISQEIMHMRLSLSSQWRYQETCVGDTAYLDLGFSTDEEYKKVCSESYQVFVLQYA